MPALTSKGFETAVDAIDGVDIAVSCRLQDWRLISPDLEPEDEDNWEQFALEPGLHHMDGDTALWFARSRLSTNDFDRGRRQQQLLRALLNQGVDVDLITQFPSLWDAYKNNVETDLDIGRMLQLASLAPAIRQNGVQHLYLVRGIVPWETPGGAQVQLPVWEGENNLEETFSRLFRYQPSTEPIAAPSPWKLLMPAATPTWLSWRQTIWPGTALSPLLPKMPQKQKSSPKCFIIGQTSKIPLTG